MSAYVLKFCTQSGATLNADVTKFLIAILALGFVFQAGNAGAQSIDSKSNARMLALQTRVDHLYESGHFERAFLIYRNELAAAGDKYAQYMVGYMTLAGQGTRQNPIEASAWYRLAAENGTKEFMMVRDELLDDLDAVDMRHADEAYLLLRRDYSDAAILLNLIGEDLDDLGEATGTRISPGSSPMMVVEGRTGRGLTGEEYYGQLRERLQTRLRLLAKITGIEDIETDPDQADHNVLENQVEQYLANIR